MAHTLPFYSIAEDARPIFHTNDACRVGQLIDSSVRRPGDGSLEPCEACIRLDAEEYAMRRE